MSIVWLFGISGTGKTTLGTRAAAEFGFTFFSCSSFLEDRQRSESYLADRDNIRSNQVTIRERVNKVRQEHLAQMVVLDAHLSICSDGSFYNISKENFGAVSTDVCLLLEVSSRIIYRRRVGIRANYRQLPPNKLAVHAALERAAFNSLPFGKRLSGGEAQIRAMLQGYARGYHI